MLIACNAAAPLADGSLPPYRPKKQKFRINAAPFVRNNLIDTTCFYVTTSRSMIRDDQELWYYAGFKGDGRMLFGFSNDRVRIGEILVTRNSWTNVQYIGYYTTNSDTLEFEYFGASGDGGRYIHNRALIRPDTLLVSIQRRENGKWITWYDTLALSRYAIGKP
jgi:hypothetical protein